MGLSLPLITLLICLLPCISNAQGSIDVHINDATQAGFSFEVDSDPPMNPTAQIFYMVTNVMTSASVPTPNDVMNTVKRNASAPCTGNLNVASFMGKPSEGRNFVEVHCKLDATKPYKLWIASDTGEIGMPMTMVPIGGYDLFIQDCSCQLLCGVNCCVGTDICVTDVGIHFCVAPDKIEHWKPVPFAIAIPGNPCAPLAAQKLLLAPLLGNPVETAQPVADTLFMVVSCVAVLIGFLIFCVVLGKRWKQTPAAHSSYNEYLILEENELDALYNSHSCQKAQPQE